MNTLELINHKRLTKRLSNAPIFAKTRKGKLAKPFHKMGGNNLYHATCQVSDSHVAYFFWKDGELRTDSKFYAWLMLIQGANLYPLLEFHYHPSHKPVHAKIPCDTDRDYTNITLPGAPELNIGMLGKVDPRTEIGRLKLIEAFCKACGITLGSGSLC